MSVIIVMCNHLKVVTADYIYIYIYIYKYIYIYIYITIVIEGLVMRY